MTPDEHQRERMRAFLVGAQVGSLNAESVLDAFDKRFPAPSAAAPVEAMAGSVGRDVSYDAGYSDGAEAVMQGMPTNAELTALRQKARLWDAVASGKLGIYPRDGDFAVHWDIGYSIRPTAAEAVESAIAQGAFK